MFDKEPNRYEELKKPEDQRRAEEKEQQRKAQEQQNAQHRNIIDDTEAKLGEFWKQQLNKVEQGRLTMHEAMHNFRQYDSELKNTIKRDDAVPAPTPEPQKFDVKRFVQNRDYRELKTGQRQDEQGQTGGLQNENTETHTKGGGRKI